VRDPRDHDDLGPLFTIEQETRRESYDAITPEVGRLQRLALELVAKAGDKGLGPFEVTKASGIEKTTMAARMTELRDKGLIVAVGKRLNPDTGRMAAVYVLVKR
jgi:hypothetical protein